MLRKHIQAYLNDDIDFDKINKLAAEVFQQAVHTSDVSLLRDFFGLNPIKSYANDLTLNENMKKMKNDEFDEFDAFFIYGNSVFLRLAYYYACQQGNLALVKYFIQEVGLPGDLMVSPNEHQKYLDRKNDIKGPPLKLAAASGNLNVVKYIYENSNATAETSLEQPIDKTALMIAVESVDVEIVRYLLQIGANVNAELFSAYLTPLKIAINNKNSAIIALLINEGAIVTNHEVNLAIKEGLDIASVELMLQHCINAEAYDTPYLLTAIMSGNLTLLLALENHPLVYTFNQISTFSDVSIEKRMIRESAKSGSLQMMRYLAETKKINLKKWISDDTTDFETYLTKKAKKVNDVALHRATGKTVLYCAAANNSRKTDNISLLQYILEELDVKPSADVLKNICSGDVRDIRAFAYLYSFLEQDKTEVAFLRSIAFDLTNYKLGQLFKIYNTSFIHRGNHLYEHGGSNWFVRDMEELIKAQIANVSSYDLLQLVKNDKEMAIGALFYFCTNEYDEQSEKLMYLLTQSIRANMFDHVDIVNCRGQTLAAVAASCHSYNIMRHLLARGANPDMPDNKGETLLSYAWHLEYKRKELAWIKGYVDKVTNSLKYESKNSFGGYSELQALLELTNGETHGVSVEELLANCWTGHNSNQKLNKLFIYLSDDNAREVIRLLKDESFRQKYQISDKDADNLITSYKSLDETYLSAETKAKRFDESKAVVNDKKDFVSRQGIFKPFEDSNEKKDATSSSSCHL